MDIRASSYIRHFAFGIFQTIPNERIFNLKTNSSYGVGDTYQIEAHLDDGTQHNVTIAIKR